MSKKAKLHAVPTSAPPAPNGDGTDPAVADLDPRDSSGLRLNDKRKPIGCLENVVKILETSVAWKGKLAFNDFTQSIEKDSPPIINRPGEIEWTDSDDDATRLWMSQKHDLRASKEDIAAAVGLVAMRNAHNPVRDYLRSLTWDNKARIDTWLQHYAGAQVPDGDVRTDEYYRLIGRWWLISAVARIFRPGCQADHVLLLEGRQGIGKSTLLRLMFGEWFSDTPLRIGDKDSYGALRGVWGYELAELDSFNRAESSASKAFFSSVQDKFRPPYGHRDIRLKRQVVFAGTVNHDQYLRDSTGNRRYWPVRCGEIRLRGPDSIEADRDQLFAEAVVRFDAADRWYPSDTDDQELFREQQAEREVGDVYEDLIYRGTLNRDEISMAEIFADILETEPAKMTRAEQTRVGEAMRRLGWEKKRRREAGARSYVYVRAGTAPALAEEDDVPF